MESQRCEGRGGGQPPGEKWVIFSGSGLPGPRSDRGPVHREAPPGLPQHLPGEEQSLPEAHAESQRCEGRGGGQPASMAWTPAQVQVPAREGRVPRARNFAAVAATEVASSGKMVQTFPFTDLVTSTACERATWSPSGAKGGGGVHQPREMCVDFSGTGLHCPRREWSPVHREAASDLPPHRSGHERWLPQSQAKPQCLEVRGGGSGPCRSISSKVRRRRRRAARACPPRKTRVPQGEYTGD